MDNQKEPIFRFSVADSREDVIAKLNHNLDLVHGTPEDSPKGTFTHESLDQYRTRKSAEAIAKRDEKARTEAERGAPFRPAYEPPDGPRRDHGSGGPVGADRESDRDSGFYDAHGAKVPGTPARL